MTSPIDAAHCLNVLRVINANEHHEVRLAFKSIFVSNKDGFNRFDELFDSFWFNERKIRNRFLELFIYHLQKKQQ